MTDTVPTHPAVARRTGTGPVALVIHPGFLDDAGVWDAFADLVRVPSQLTIMACLVPGC
jgi:hypothetical protein